MLDGKWFLVKSSRKEAQGVGEKMWFQIGWWGKVSLKTGYLRQDFKEVKKGELYDSLGKGPPGKESAGAKTLRQECVAARHIEWMRVREIREL